MASTIILCPVDFSSTSDSALAFATSLAREQQKKLVMLHVEGHPMPYGKRLYGSLPSPYERDRQRLDTLAPTSDVQFEKVLLVGDPVEEICSFAKQHPVDLVTNQ